MKNKNFRHSFQSDYSDEYFLLINNNSIVYVNSHFYYNDKGKIIITAYSLVIFYEIILNYLGWRC